MSETENWIEQARKLLEGVMHNKKNGSLDALYDHMKRIDLPVALRDLGCGDQCSECSWGELGGLPLRGTCRLVTFQHILEETETNGKDRASIKRQAAALLDMLENFPRPGPEPITA